MEQEVKTVVGEIFGRELIIFPVQVSMTQMMWSKHHADNTYNLGY